MVLSLPRRLIGDVVHFAHQVPTVPMQRQMALAAVVSARRSARPRPAWCAVFVKAYAIVAASCPELRRAYMAFPRPHLYEHARNVASVAVERELGEEPAVLFGHLREPETQSLRELDAQLRHFKEAPVHEIRSFGRALTLSRWPRPLRRWRWCMGLHLWGAKRAHYFGTFGISVYGSRGASSLHPLSPLTTTLNYGAIQSDGTVDVRLIYDERVLGGSTAARALQQLEIALHREILAELQALTPFHAERGGRPARQTILTGKHRG
jgi:hypothetical protein